MHVLSERCFRLVCSQPAHGSMAHTQLSHQLLKESTLNNYNMSEQPKDEKSDTHINLKVSDGTAEIFFKIKKTTPMKRLMEAFCKRQGKSMESLRFLIDGTRVSPDNTPEDLDLEDGDVIEAHREQVGGSL